MDKIKKFLKKIDKRVKKRIDWAIEDILNRNTYGYDILRLSGGKRLYRIRIGRYRIIFYMDSSKVHIIDVDKRDDNTYHGL